MNDPVLRQSLELELRRLYNDDDYVIGALSIASGDYARVKLLAFINYAKEINDDITSDDVLAVALRLDNEYGEKPWT